MVDTLSPWHRQNDSANGYIFRAGYSTFARRNAPTKSLFANSAFRDIETGSRRGKHARCAFTERDASEFQHLGLRDERLVRGSGLFVGEAGISANHHFLAPRDGSSFRFTEGRYRMEVFAQLLGDRERMMLFSQTLEISREIAAQLAEPDCGLYFDWGPDSSCYMSHIDKRPPLPNEDFLELLNLTRRSKSRSGA
jgi:hypothetical protein